MSKVFKHNLTPFIVFQYRDRLVFLTLCFSLLFTFPNDAIAGYQDDCLDFHVIQSEPIGYINNKGKLTGIHWDYIEAIKQHSGLCINTFLMPYARIWESIKNGDHDGGIIFKSDNRTKLVKYAAHIKNSSTVVIPLEGITLNTYNDLYDLLIGNMRGAHLSEKFDNDKNLNIVEVKDFDQETKMISLKRLDAIAGNALVLEYQLKKFNVLDKVNLDNKLVLGEKEQWLQLSRKSQKLQHLPALQKTVLALKQQGIFKQIRMKYYGATLVNAP